MPIDAWPLAALPTCPLTIRQQYIAPRFLINYVPIINSWLFPPVLLQPNLQQSQRQWTKWSLAADVASSSNSAGNRLLFFTFTYSARGMIINLSSSVHSSLSAATAQMNFWASHLTVTSRSSRLSAWDTTRDERQIFDGGEKSWVPHPQGMPGLEQLTGCLVRAMKIRFRKQIKVFSMFIYTLDYKVSHFCEFFPYLFS